MAVEIVCLIVSIIYFAYKCVSNNIEDGNNLYRIHEVMLQYAMSGRFFLDMASIVLRILAFCLLDSIIVFQILFFVLLPVLFYNVRNLIRLEAAFFSTPNSLAIWRIVKLFISNLVIIHIMSAFVLGMAKLNP